MSKEPIQIHDGGSIKRTIIQISTTPANDEEYHTTTALCNDGTVWSYELGDTQGWVRLPDIPQDK